MKFDYLFFNGNNQISLKHLKNQNVKFLPESGQKVNKIKQTTSTLSNESQIKAKSS